MHSINKRKPEWKESKLSESVDPELITIVEGLTPEFHIDAAPWAMSVPRTGGAFIGVPSAPLNGEIDGRCRRAWQESAHSTNFRQPMDCVGKWILLRPGQGRGDYAEPVGARK
jgi:hypothetical protein